MHFRDERSETRRGKQRFRHQQLFNIRVGFQNQFFQLPVQCAFLLINNVWSLFFFYPRLPIPPAPLPSPAFSFHPWFSPFDLASVFFILSPFLSSCLFLWVKTASLVNIASSLKPRRGLLELSRTCASISLILVLTKQSCFVLVTVLPLA